MAKNSQKKQPQKRILPIVLCAILAAALLFGSGVLGYFTHKWTKGEAPAKEDTAVQGGMVIGTAEEYGIALASEKISVEDYAASRISSAAESAVSVKATLKDYNGDTLSSENADRVKLTWSTMWGGLNGINSQEDVKEYVEVAPAEDTHSATVSCMKPFATAITLTVAVSDDTEVSASIQLDYMQKYDHIEVRFAYGKTEEYGPTALFNSKTDALGGVYIDFPPQTVGWESSGKIDVTIVGTSVYTIPMRASLNDITVTSFAKDKITAAGGTPVGDKSTMIRYSSDPVFPFRVAQMLGVAYYGEMTLNELRSQFAKDTSFSSSIQYAFNIEVNETALERMPTCSIYFNTASLYVSASSIELDRTGIAF